MSFWRDVLRTVIDPACFMREEDSQMHTDVADALRVLRDAAVSSLDEIHAAAQPLPLDRYTLMMRDITDAFVRVNSAVLCEAMSQRAGNTP